MREERLALGGHELVLRRPDDPESLIDEARFAEDEFLPYWAELWPSAVALAHEVVALDLTGKAVLELGCGLAVPSFAAVLAGATPVLATDWAPEAVELVEANAAANGLAVTAAVLDWTAAPGRDARLRSRRRFGRSLRGAQRLAAPRPVAGCRRRRRRGVDLRPGAPHAQHSSTARAAEAGRSSRSRSSFCRREASPGSGETGSPCRASARRRTSGDAS